MAGQRGRPACRWHSHDVRYEVQTQGQRKQRAQRGRPPNDEPVYHDRMYRLKVAAKALGPPVATFGWLVLATTVREQMWSDAEIVRAYRDQTTTVEPGLRWIKNPAAISPVWLEKPQRLAAWARLTVVGLLVYSLIQRQGRQCLPQHQPSIPGNQGDTARPTATVVLESFPPVTLVQRKLDGVDVRQVQGWQERHRLIYQALGVDVFWYEGAADQKMHPTRLRAP